MAKNAPSEESDDAQDEMMSEVEELEPPLTDDLTEDELHEALETLVAERDYHHRMQEIEDHGYGSFLEGIEEDNSPFTVEEEHAVWLEGFTTAQERYELSVVVLAVKGLLESETEEETDEAFSFLSQLIEGIGYMDAIENFVGAVLEAQE